MSFGFLYERPSVPDPLCIMFRQPHARRSAAAHTTHFPCPLYKHTQWVRMHGRTILVRRRANDQKVHPKRRARFSFALHPSPQSRSKASSIPTRPQAISARVRPAPNTNRDSPPFPPASRTPADHSEKTSWHMLLEADGAPGAVGRALVTVRNLGGGRLPRPAWGFSLPGGSVVHAPAGYVRGDVGWGGGGGEEAGGSAWERADRKGLGVREGEEGREEGVAEGEWGRRRRGRGGEEESDELWPENPLLEAFFPRGCRLHEALFFRIGSGCCDGHGKRGRERVLPFNERVSQRSFVVLMWWFLLELYA